MKTLITFFMVLLTVGCLSSLVLPAQDAQPSGSGRRGRGAGRGGGPAETWWVNKPPGGESAYKAPMRPLWRLADLKQMHAGQNTWSQLIIRDTEQDVTYNSGAPGTKITPRIHPDTPTAFVIIAGQIRFNVEGQEPTVAQRGSIIHIMKTAIYSAEVIGGENALWIEVNILGYTTLYPTAGVKPSALPGAPLVKVSFPRSPASYTGSNKLHFNTLDAIASCTVGPAVADDHMFINPLLGFVNPADNKCGGGSGNIGGGPDKPGDPPFNTKAPFGHLHSGAVEWWIVQVGAIGAKFENFPEFHAVEGDVLYAAPMTWHEMAAEAPSGPSVRLAMGAHQRISMQNTGPAEP
jgi:mannose-6-phosphate isomerase-like protein (cupin superfamily)